MGSRRDFISDITGTSAALCCIPAAVLLDGCTSVKTIQASVVKGKLVVDQACSLRANLSLLTMKH